MAELNTEGLEELSYAFLRQEEEATATVEAMLEAEAQVYTEKLKESAQAYGIKKTGGFINSIKASKTKREDLAVYKTISPECKAKHGADYGGGYSNKANKRQGSSSAGNVRYGAIGFIFEYGTSSMPARPWFTQGNLKAEDEAHKKAMEIWEKYVEDSFK